MVTTPTTDREAEQFYLELFVLVALLLPAKWLYGMGQLTGNLTAVLLVYICVLGVTAGSIHRFRQARLARLFGRFEARHLLIGLPAGIGLFVLGGMGYVVSQAILGLTPPAETQLYLATEPAGSILLVAILIVGAYIEEYVFRGLLLDRLHHTWPSYGGVLLSAALFSVYHLSAFQLLPTFVWGIGLALLVVRTNSLWPAVVAHVLVNTLGFGLFAAGITSF